MKSFSLGPRKITEDQNQVGWSYKYPDANGLPTSIPALNTRTLTPVPICPSVFQQEINLNNI
jgi:hypothetical protein